MPQLRCIPGDLSQIKLVIDSRNMISRDTGSPRHTQESFVHELLVFWDRGHCPECDAAIELQNHTCSNGVIEVF
jgi:hypothetical protein